MSTIERVIRVISRETGISKETIPVETDFVEALHLNTFEEALLYLEIEKELNIVFPDEMMPKLRTASQIQKYIH
jgi:acyl carrier protein